LTHRVYCAVDYLPDACLSEIAQGVGNDWRHLANQLRISVSEEYVTDQGIRPNWPCYELGETDT